jgi:hypothetical protein
VQLTGAVGDRLSAQTVNPAASRVLVLSFIKFWVAFIVVPVYLGCKSRYSVRLASVTYDDQVMGRRTRRSMSTLSQRQDTETSQSPGRIQIQLHSLVGDSPVDLLLYVRLTIQLLQNKILPLALSKMGCYKESPITRTEGAKRDRKWAKHNGVKRKQRTRGLLSYVWLGEDTLATSRFETVRYANR